jgi:replicative DNA helicase
MEQTILKNLIYNEDYSRRVLPFLKPEYFTDSTEQGVFTVIDEFIREYNSMPNSEILGIELSKQKNFTDTQYNESLELLTSFEDTKDELIDDDWLLDSSEKFCKDQALYIALMNSVELLDEYKGTKDLGEIPKIMQDALGITFDDSVGHDYFANSDERFEFYHTREEKIKFDLDLFNKITKGGLSKKSLNIILAGTGVGKSLFMCHCAAANINNGANVLYITMEMAEERIAERIDANLLDVELADLRSLSKSDYDEKIQYKRDKTVGDLIVKEYPTAGAHTGHFRHLINELKLKKSFEPDIIYIDYLNICASSRIKPAMAQNTYTYVKSIAEEIRGLAVETGVPIMSATQTTRSGFSNTDVDITDTSESFGLPATADFMVALITSEDLEELDQIQVKQLKNRYNDPTKYRKFVIGIDRAKMRLYDLEDSAQDDLILPETDVGDGGMDFSGFQI